MSSNLVIVTLLSFITWMSLTHANNGRVSNCCLLLSNTKTYLENIVNYTIQSDSVCPIKAVVFHTKRGKRICSDPESEWAKKAIAKVDAARQALQMKGNNEEGSTTDITPAMPTTSKNAPTTRAKNNGPASSCCVGWSTTKPQLKNIVNYTIQSDSICTIKAIVFHTIYGKNICSDPKNGWAKKAIAKVDAARQALQMKGNNEEGSTTDITPAVPTTSKKTKAPARKARSERKPRKKRLLRKNMRKRKCCC